MVMVEPIEEILIHMDPALDYGPDWMPTPAPPRSIPVLGARGDWSDVWDWVKEHAILPRGVPIDDPFGTIAQVQQMIDAAMGSTITGLSGFMNRTAALTIQAAALLDDAITNLDAKETVDFRELSQRLDRVVQVQDYFIDYAFPAVEAQIAQANQTALANALHAIEYSQQWTTQNVLVPLVESLGSLETRMTQVISLVGEQAQQISAQQVAGLSAQLEPQIATALASGYSNKTWIDDCGEPMCQTMGPKTDLGKLLKAFKAAGWIALLAEIAAIRAGGLDSLVADIGGWGARVIGELETLFFAGGKTLGETIGSLPG